MSNLNKPFTSQLSDFIEAGIEKEAKKIVESHKEEMLKELDSAISDIVAKITVRMTKQFSIQDMGETIRIEVRKEL